jgi:phosphatidylserine/phosphatidylglycerophosphate/cardiolipin synthase-like enzyme
MRVTKGAFSVRAIAGSHAILFGFDCTRDAARGLLGFALGRRQPDSKVRWLRGFKFFAETMPDPQPGERRSTREHPVQDFQWGDYAVTPGETYDYVIQPLFGTPSAIGAGPDLDIRVTAQSGQGNHAVFYNRGAIPSQAFADRFGNVGPTEDEQNDPANEKTRWLSRGLLEAALLFIGQARGPGQALHVAAYEFTYPPIAEALAEAARRGAEVHLVYDAGELKRDGTLVPTHTSGPNAALIAAAGLDRLPSARLYPRTRYGNITHNKFMILSDAGHPLAVWTGSTNFTASGFLGQSNLAHRIVSPDLAVAFRAYWDLLAGDPTTRVLKRALALLTPDPSQPLPDNATVPVFAPRPDGMLGWYAGAMAAAQSSVMFTAAFGVARPLAEVFGLDSDYLKLILAEREESNPERRALLARDRDTKIALGARLNSQTIALGLDGDRLDQWFRAEEHFRTRGHIFYIHTKLMALDLLGEMPQIFTGSANFSDGSVGSNDENMILMRGPAFTAVAETHATEFMRLWNHLYFRTVALRRAGKPARGAHPAMLDPDDRWVAPHFRAGGYHDRMRNLFR